MRKFFLQNEYGERRSLQDTDAFMHQTSGWGFENELSYVEASGFFIQVGEVISQVNKTGEIVFRKPNPYDKYREFMAWVFKAKSLVLVYKPTDTEYYMLVDIIRVDKSEIGETGDLLCPIEFAPKSPIYEPYDVNVVFPDEGSKKVYPYRRPFRYGTTAKKGTVLIELDAQMESAFELRITGFAEDIVFSARNHLTGVEIGRIDLTGEVLEAGETLRYSSVPTTAGLYIDGATRRDLTNTVKINEGLPVFFNIPPYTPVEFTLNVSQASPSSTTRMVVQKYNRTV